MRTQDKPVFIMPILEGLIQAEGQFTTRGLASALTTLGFLARHQEDRSIVRSFLAGKLNHPKKAVQTAAMRALEQLQDPRSIPILRNWVHGDPEDERFKAARKAINSLDKQIEHRAPAIAKPGGHHGKDYRSLKERMKPPKPMGHHGSLQDLDGALRKRFRVLTLAVVIRANTDLALPPQLRVMQPKPMSNASPSAENPPTVGIIMGSDSDWPTMKAAATVCLRHQLRQGSVCPPHPKGHGRLREEAHQRGLKVIIAGAGGATHLPGMIASHTPLPVIGVPVQSKSLSGMDPYLNRADARRNPGGYGRYRQCPERRLTGHIHTRISGRRIEG